MIATVDLRGIAEEIERVTIGLAGRFGPASLQTRTPIQELAVDNRVVQFDAAIDLSNLAYAQWQQHRLPIELERPLMVIQCGGVIPVVFECGAERRLGSSVREHAAIARLKPCATGAVVAQGFSPADCCHAGVAANLRNCLQIDTRR